MSDSARRLGLAVDAVVREVLALAPAGTDVSPLHAALGDLIAEALNAVSAQNAGAIVAVREELDRRIQKLERRKVVE